MSEYVIKRDIQEPFRSSSRQEAIVWVEEVMPDTFYKVHMDYLPGPVGLDMIPTTIHVEDNREAAVREADQALQDAEVWQTDPKYN